MLKSILNKLPLIFLITVFIGCGSKKRIVKMDTSVAIPRSTTAEKIKDINAAALRYSSLSLRAKADLQLNGNSNDVTMTFRIRSGQAIWVSITAIAGLEVARALITPDSIKVLNKLESTYTKKAFSYIYEFTNDQVKFATIEALIVGNPVNEVLTGQSELTMLGKEAVLSGLIKSLIYKVKMNDNNKVVLTSFSDDQADQSLVADYSSFQEVQGQQVPHQINIQSSAGRKNVVMDLRYNRVEIDQAVDMPFSVPKRFTVKN